MIPKLERDFLAANLASVEELISRMTPSDFVTRMSLEGRRDELKAELETLDQTDVAEASSLLFFGGLPITAGRGIDADFGAAAISKYQDLVSKVHAANQLGNLGERGVVPAKEESRLNITGVVHGSFGFQFEELPSQLTMTANSHLKEAVDQVSKLMNAFDEVDDDAFTEAVTGVDDRIVSSARDFFELVQNGGATFRIVSGEIDKTFDRPSIGRAVARARITSVQEDEQTFEGSLNGVLPENRDFEFRTLGRGAIKGKIARTVLDETVAVMNRDWTGKPSKITVHVKRVIRQGVVRREAFAMTKLEPATSS